MVWHFPCFSLDTFNGLDIPAAAIQNAESLVFMDNYIPANPEAMLQSACDGNSHGPNDKRDWALHSE